jgi:hypothetical protein
MQPRFLALAALLSACMPIAPDTVAPKDASFRVLAASGCGKDGRAPSLVIDVTFGGTQAREFRLCCSERDALLAKLTTIRDLACSGLEVPSSRVGGLDVGVTTSEVTGKVAATLDAGDGFVAFQCEGWLPKLIVDLEKASCGSTPATQEAEAATLEEK